MVVKGKRTFQVEKFGRLGFYCQSCGPFLGARHFLEFRVIPDFLSVSRAVADHFRLIRFVASMATRADETKCSVLIAFTTACASHFGSRCCDQKLWVVLTFLWARSLLLLISRFSVFNVVTFISRSWILENVASHMNLTMTCYDDTKTIRALLPSTLPLLSLEARTRPI